MLIGNPETSPKLIHPTRITKPRTPSLSYVFTRKNQNSTAQSAGGTMPDAEIEHHLAGVGYIWRTIRFEDDCSFPVVDRGARPYGDDPAHLFSWGIEEVDHFMTLRKPAPGRE